MPDIEDETMAEETAARPEKTTAKGKAPKGSAKSSPDEAAAGEAMAAESAADLKVSAPGAEGVAGGEVKTSGDDPSVESPAAMHSAGSAPEATASPAAKQDDLDSPFDLTPEAETGKASDSMPQVWQQLIAAESRVQALTAESSDLKDRLLRAAAEMENLRRRTEREVADGRQYAVTSFAREIVQVGDNLRRAIETVPAAEQGERSGPLASLLEGIEATERLFYHVLSKHGVRRLEPKGEKFDANFHQAMYETENPGDQPGTVTNVLQPGYAIGERVLRPALVSVAKSAKNKAPSSG